MAAVIVERKDLSLSWLNAANLRVLSDNAGEARTRDFGQLLPQ
jgi:hypothetical protein